MLDYINACDWVDYTESAGFDNLVLCSDEEIYYDNDIEVNVIGETEYCFCNEMDELSCIDIM